MLFLTVKLYVSFFFHTPSLYVAHPPSARYGSPLAIRWHNGLAHCPPLTSRRVRLPTALSRLRLLLTGKQTVSICFFPLTIHTHILPTRLLNLRHLTHSFFNLPLALTTWHYHAPYCATLGSSPSRTFFTSAFFLLRSTLVVAVVWTTLQFNLFYFFATLLHLFFLLLVKIH